MVRMMLAGALALAPVAAHAATYDVVTDFNAPVFSYGSGTNGANFTALPFTDATNCFGVSGFSCHQTSANNQPVIGVNTTGSTLTFSTLIIPTDALLFHPADATPDTDALLTFTAPTTSSYQVTGNFLRLDTTNSGNGTVVSIFKSISGNSSSLFSATLAPTSFGSSTSFGTLTFALAAGDTVTFGVNNNAGTYGFDSTGLQASIAAVPEPAAWALMIGGFGLVGAASRRRKLALA